MQSCSNAKIWRSPARRLITPICRPCGQTASALSFFGSNFILRPLVCFLLVVGRGVDGTFLTLALLIRAEMIAEERPHGWNKGAGDHQEVAVEDAHELEPPHPSRGASRR